MRWASAGGTAQVAAVAAYPTLLTASSITVPALGLIRLARPRAPRLATVGAALICLSGIAAVGDAMTQFMTWQMVTPCGS